MNVNHRELREELGAYALGQLTGDRWRTVHDHLATCAACRAELEEIAPVAGLLGSVRDRVRADDHTDGAETAAPPLPEALITEVRAAADRAAPPPASPAGRRRVPRWLVAAAAALAVLAGGAGYLAGSGTGAAARPTAAGPLEAVAVRVLDPAVSARAALVPHTWGMEVRLTATGFAPGAAFTVTVTDDAGRTVGAGEFLGIGPDEMRCNLNSSILRADAELVQVRAADGSVVLDLAV